ncbi:uncharacterized protein LOC122304773 [Carya illinoinensis]|uniref:uncharacterized protein LOC122304773 n=1 Tax=Carya illinoinensis TaxID=32201 RepID=UPI001C728769|nr:uncharacterized protein LOC122304773 [Carya illinoinensis]
MEPEDPSKIFAWKACKESLPTKHNLMQKKVLSEDMCKMCNTETEDVAHALCFCPSVREAWEKQLPVIFNSDLPNMYGDIAGFISGLQQKDQLELFFLAIAHALAVQHVYKATRGQPLKAVRHHCRWEFPLPGVFKLNVDGATFLNQHSAGIGAILRDSKGEVLMAASKKEHEVRDATSIEMLAIFRGLQLTAHLGIQHLIIESDALTLVQELQKPKPSMALVGNVIRDTKELMSLFHMCEVRYTMRSCNEAAHKLARHAWHVSNINLWWGSFPDVIAPVLWTERQL